MNIVVEDDIEEHLEGQWLILKASEKGISV